MELDVTGFKREGFFTFVLHGLHNALKKFIYLANDGMVKCNVSIRLVSNPVDLG